MTTKKAKFTCPECGKKYDSAKGMGGHRRVAHGVLGTAPSSVASRQKKELKDAMKLPPPVPLYPQAKASKEDLKCPECGEVFEQAKYLGVHRRMKHSVMGTASASVSEQKKREAYMANYERDKNGMVICPECRGSFKPAGITNHRQQLHHISSAAQAAMFENNKLVAKIETSADSSDPNQCPHCPFVAKDERGLRTHIGHRHELSMHPYAIAKREQAALAKRERNTTIDSPTQTITLAETNGHHTEEVPLAASGYTIPDATLAVALGRFQGLCQSFSVEFDLPPRMFAARLAELIYHTQVRESPRTRVRMSSL